MLALGTAVGSILLYSTVKGELHSKLIVSTYLYVYVLYKRCWEADYEKQNSSGYVIGSVV